VVEFGISLMPEPEFAQAALPLVEEGLFDVVEWSFDMGWGSAGAPDWIDALCKDYGDSNSLLGHGVSFSLLAGEWTNHHQTWIDRLTQEVDVRNYRHISEHIGFVGAGRFSFSAPMPMPYHRRVVALGQQRLAALASAAGCQVGVENLATSFGAEDALAQGALVAELIDPVDGFVVLDLHNLWCQTQNVHIPWTELVSTYPLNRVLEVHVSGGSWDDDHGRSIRRDTHDGSVPNEVIELLATVTPQLPNLQTVIYERLGTSLQRPADHDEFRSDVRCLAQEVARL